jgi:outer membrane protein assembly factor BamB
MASRAGTAVGLTSIVLLLSTLAPCEGVPGSGWNQYRGPARDGKSLETGLIRSWGPDGPREIWRVGVGAGFSGVSVVSDRLYTMDSDEATEHALCLDARSGETLWQVSIGPIFRDPNGDGPRAAPTVDGDLVYVLGSRGRLAALDASSGRVVWQRQYTEAFASELPVWGFASAPLVDGEQLVVEVGGTGARAIAALEKRTGRVRWTAQEAKIAYSAPIPLAIGGLEQLVFLLQEKVVALDREGNEIWTFPWAADLDIKPALPLFVAPDRVMVSASYDTGATLLQVNTAGKAAVEEVWSSRYMRNHINSSVAVDGSIYGFDTGTLRCLDAQTGEGRWAKRGLGKGSLIFADGMLIVLSERGKLVLLEATPKGYRELAAHQVLEGRCWTAPSLWEGRLYLRNHTELVCLDLRARVAD